jgi:hypothetical protein
MPSMAMFMEVSDLQPTGQKTNLLGFACEQYEIKQNGETMTLWATGELFPFRNYVVHQMRQYGPRPIEDRWGGLLMARKLFPLRASLRTQDGPERFHFEVLTVKPHKVPSGDASLFLPPEGYLESRPLPF